jgi:hypothetical protein
MYSIRGIDFKSRDEVYSHFKIERRNVERQMKSKNLSFEEVVSLILNRRDNKKIRPFNLEGVDYSSLHSACKVYEIPYATVYRRIFEWGYSVEEAFLTPVKRVSNSKNSRVKKSNRSIKERIIFKGINFPSLSILCKKLNIEEENLILYLSNGVSLETALSTLLLVDNRMLQDEILSLKESFYEIFGVYYVTFEDACYFHNVNSGSVRMKIRRGSSKEEAFHHFINKEPFELRGVVFKTFTEACKVTGVAYSRTRMRVIRGDSKEKAFELPKGEKYTIGKLEYKDFFEACNMLNVNSTSVIENHREGLSREDSFYKAYFSRSSFYISDVDYGSFNNACVSLKRNKDEVFLNIVNGWSRKEAFDLIPKGFEEFDDLKVVTGLGNGYYKCIHSGKIKYYSADELFEMERKAKEGGF